MVEQVASHAIVCRFGKVHNQQVIGRRTLMESIGSENSFAKVHL